MYCLIFADAFEGISGVLGPLEYPESFLSVPRGRETPLARETPRPVDDRDETLASPAKPSTTMLAKPLTRPARGPLDSDRLDPSRRLRGGYGAVAERVIVGGARGDDGTF